MLSIRGGSGLGDSLYIQSIARHLVETGEAVEVCSNWPDVFRPLAGKVAISPFRRDRIDRLAHYTNRKGIAGTDQFQDCCLRAGITEQIDLRLDWTPLDGDLIGRVRASRRPVIVVQLPRAPMARTDGVGRELLPDCRVIQRIINRIGKRAFFVQVGTGVPLYCFKGIDLDLAGRTSVAGLIDVVSACDGCLGYVSFIVPLAESLNKPALLVWSWRGLESRHDFIRQIVLAKILHRTSSRAIFDNGPESDLEAAADAFLEQVGDHATI